MGQSLVRLVVHIVFSTKDRRPIIPDSLREGLNAYLVGILRQIECTPIKTNSVADHAHILCGQSKNIAIAKLVEEVKKGSSKWMKTQSADLRTFYWQTGYGAFSVSESNVESVKAYIANQEARHRRMTFQEELLALLKRHGVKYGPQYIWT